MPPSLVMTDTHPALVGATSRDVFPEIPKTDLRARAMTWAGPAFSVAVLLVIFSQVNLSELNNVAARVPGVSVFWLIFGCFYLTIPIAEWTIYRHVWRLPAVGIVPLLRKQVANELVLGYAGEAQFYLWARRHAGVTGSPFGVIKDVTVLSAVAGNLSALAAMLVMAPFLSLLLAGPFARTFAISIIVVVLTSLVPFAFRRRLFCLPRRDLRLIFVVHVSRIFLALTFLVCLWHLLLPAVAIGQWLALATLRMMLSRLPLLPNKDILFAGATMLLLGRHAEIPAMLALVASLVLAAHLVVGIVTAIAAIADRRSA